MISTSSVSSFFLRNWSVFHPASVLDQQISTWSLPHYDHFQKPEIVTSPTGLVIYHFRCKAYVFLIFFCSFAYLHHFYSAIPQKYVNVLVMIARRVTFSVTFSVAPASTTRKPKGNLPCLSSLQAPVTVNPNFVCTLLSGVP